MRQRVALAAALARDPKLLIADEPSTALDVTTQAEVMKLLARVQHQRGMSLILITHDLRLAVSICDRIYILYAGSVMEEGMAKAVEREPLHPYTLGLLLSEPPAERRVKRLVAIRGAVPRAEDVGGCCTFAERCDWAEDRCRAAKPTLASRDDGRRTACIRQPEIAAEMATLRRQTVDAEASAEAMAATARSAVYAEGLVKTFQSSGRPVFALKGVTVDIRVGEAIGLVGESGSGKTTLGRCVVGLETPSAGRIEIDGIDATDFAGLTAQHRAQIRRRVQMVFQDPYSTLNPKHTIRRSLVEALRMAPAQPDNDGRGLDDRVADLLREVGLPAAYAGRRPASLSGGERQRVAIARALAVNPEVLVCDEPASALDVSVQAQILNLFKRLQAQRRLSYLFITHDLAVVRQVVDRVYVLYLGEIVEQGETERVMTAPQHPYTRKLIESIP